MERTVYMLQKAVIQENISRGEKPYFDWIKPGCAMNSDSDPVIEVESENLAEVLGVAKNRRADVSVREGYNCKFFEVEEYFISENLFEDDDIIQEVDRELMTNFNGLTFNFGSGCPEYYWNSEKEEWETLKIRMKISKKYRNEWFICFDNPADVEDSAMMTINLSSDALFNDEVPFTIFETMDFYKDEIADFVFKRYGGKYEIDEDSLENVVSSIENHVDTLYGEAGYDPITGEKTREEA